MLAIFVSMLKASSQASLSLSASALGLWSGTKLYGTIIAVPSVSVMSSVTSWAPISPQPSVKEEEPFTTAKRTATAAVIIQFGSLDGNAASYGQSDRIGFFAVEHQCTAAFIHQARSCCRCRPRRFRRDAAGDAELLGGCCRCLLPQARVVMKIKETPLLKRSHKLWGPSQVIVIKP